MLGAWERGKLLPHHLLMLDLLQMTSFLHYPVFPIVLVASLNQAQPLEQGPDFVRLR
jgi:hypothetical protein